MNEFALIDTFVAPFRKVKAPRGPGDDCAVLPPSGRTTCVTTDALVEDVHFTRATFTLEDVGYKALAVNLSDLASMGVRPTWAVCALGLPSTVTSPEVRALARGMAELANAEGVELVGGNVTRSPVLSLTLTVSGELEPGRSALLRSGARAGDVLVLTGGVGDAAAGLNVLTRTGGWPRTPGERQLALAQRRPTPHLAAGQVLGAFASACIDVSDGLVQDLEHVCTASKVGVDVETARVPCSEALVAETGSRARALDAALGGGEDYVLAATVPPKNLPALERALAKAGLAAVQIGTVQKGRGVRIDGRRWTRRAGFQHFR